MNGEATPLTPEAEAALRDLISEKAAAGGPVVAKNAARLLPVIDRLRAIEAAARAHVAWEYRERGAPRFTLTNLRSALDPSPPAEERKP